MLIQVRFDDGTTEMLDEHTVCWVGLVITQTREDPIDQHRGETVWIPAAGRNGRVETTDEQIARLTAERDAWERSARDIAAGSDARGATIWRLQNRLSRWYRRFTRVDVALRQWKPLAQAWQARCEEAQAGERAEKARADAAEKRLAGLRAWAVEMIAYWRNAIETDDKAPADARAKWDTRARTLDRVVLRIDWGKDDEKDGESK